MMWRAVAAGSAAFGKTWAFLVRRLALRSIAIFAQPKPIGGERAACDLRKLSSERRDIMDYVVVFVTMLMIAGYACIIGRALRGTE